CILYTSVLLSLSVFFSLVSGPPTSTLFPYTTLFRSALWDRPQATFASALRIDGSRAIVDREVDTGIETIEVDLPAVVTADLRLNQPRYVKLPEMLKAKRKPIDVVFLAELGVDTTPQFRTLRYETPERRRRGRIVASPAELIDALIERGVLR